LSSYQISPKALADLDHIFLYTEQSWSEAQAVKYLEDFAATFQLLAGSPSLGRACTSLASGLRRFEHEQHVIFYRRAKSGVRIIRILHQRMMPDRHSLS
jgi:toxin ParE1/3/4